MTQQEKQEIIEAVLEALQTNSQSISQLTPVTELVDSDLFEVAGGKRVTFANIVASLLSSSGYAAATEAEQAEMWQVLMANFVATQGNESVGGVQPPLTHWSQSRVVLLKSMGAPFDDVDVSTLSVGDLIYSSQGKWILEKLENNLGNGIHPSDGVLYVNLATFKAYRWDGTSFQDAIKGGNGASSVTAFAQYSVVESTSELPSVGDPTTGYIVGTHIYAYVGEDGDTADGKYQDLGELNAAGLSVTTNGDGTFTIHAGGNDYTVNLNHTHENMAKLVVCEESDLPSTRPADTIFAVVDNASVPTEVQRLFVGSAEFVAGAAETGVPQVVSPSNTVDIDMGIDTNGVFTQLINVKAKNISSAALTVAVSGTGYSLSYGQLTGQSSITVPAANALLGELITVVCDASSSANEQEEGTLVITSSELSGAYSANLVARLVRYNALAAVKFTKQQYVETAIYPGPNTRLEIDMKFDGSLATPDKVTTDYNFIGGGTVDGESFLCSVSSTTTVSKMSIPLNVASEAIILDISGSKNTTRSTLVINNVSKEASYLGETASLPTRTKTATAGMKFGSNSSGAKPLGSYDIILYSLKHYENGVLTHNYLPYTRNGVAGLYDTETNTFISSGTGVALVAVNS